MPGREALEALLMEQIAPLRQRYRAIGIHLDAPDGVEAVPGEALLDPATLGDHVARFGARIGTDDRRIAAVHWLGQVGYAILPPIEMAMTRAGIGLDASLANLALLQPDGQPDAVLIRDTSGAVVLPARYRGALPLPALGHAVATEEDLRAFVVARLFGRTFRPLVESLHDLTGVSRQVLWGQVAYEADLFYQQLARVEPAARDAAWEADRATLFERDGWAVAPGPNPLKGPTRTVTVADPAGGAPTSRTLRATCCLIYRAPGGRMCGGCPLGPKREVVGAKLATVTERRAARGLPAGGPV